jgi:Tol biopolymer transport system component
MLAGILRRPVVLLALAVLALAGIVSLLGRLASGPPVEMKRVAVSDDAGTELFGAFSPDGRQVAYSSRASGKVDTFHIAVRDVPRGVPRLLTSGSGNDTAPAWSPDGSQLAFARSSDGQAGYFVVPSAGGEPRALEGVTGPAEAQPLPSVAWAGDGQRLVVVRKRGAGPSALALVPARGGAPQDLTKPPEGSDGDTMPAVSPDGRTVAFVRRTGPETADIWVCDMTGGALRQITFDDHQIRGIAWTGDGREIVFASNPWGRGWRIWRVSVAGGAPRDVPLAGKQAQFPSVARKGDRLLYAESPSVASIWRAALTGTAGDQSLIRSTGRDHSASFSPDGRRIAFVSDRTGSDQIWVADSDGANPVQLSHVEDARLGRPRWSPDASALIFDHRTQGRPEIYRLPAAGGQAVKLTSIAASNPSWSRDGRTIYFGQRQIWRMTAGGGTPEQLSKRGGSNPVESADGQWIYYLKGREIWRMPVAGGEGELLFEPEHNLFFASVVAARAGLYYMEWDMVRRSLAISLLDVSTRKSKPLFSLARADMDRGASFDISPDGRYAIYPKVDQVETNLVLVEGFR